MNLPDFLKKRALQPKVIDPMEKALQLRAETGNLKRPNPLVKPQIEEVFKLKQTGTDVDGQEVNYHDAPHKLGKPPKAVYVKRNRQELYEHKLVQKPFNWFDQKTAKQTLQNFLDENKAVGEV